jgi:hypothetical protein
MILDRLLVGPAEFERRSGWEIKPEGACKGDLCVPLPAPDEMLFDVRMLAERLGMPLVADEAAGLWALGPESGRVLASAEAPDFTLPDWRGAPHTLSGLRGQKVLVVAWAPW